MAIFQKNCRVLFIDSYIKLNTKVPGVGSDVAWDMEASAEDNGYVHFVTERIRKSVNNINAEIKYVKVTGIECGLTESDKNEYSYLRDFAPHIIIVRLIENIDEDIIDLSELGFHYQNLIEYLDKTGKIKVIFIGNTPVNSKLEEVIKKVSRENSYKYINLALLQNDGTDRGIHKQLNKDVDQHPKDERMTGITDIIYSQIKPWISIKTEYDKGKQLVRYTTGNTIYEEKLYKSRWIGLYWSAIARIDDNPQIYENTSLLESGAFNVVVDGQSLHRGWNIEDVYNVDDDSLTDHTVVILMNEIRPIRIYIHTRNDGTEILSRWLEIQNTGANPAAISDVVAWSGRVFPAQTGNAVWGLAADYITAHGPYYAGYFANQRYANEGWYSDKGTHWGDAVGRWRPSNKLKGGLKPVFDYAKSKSLKCGLWVWIEAASKNSELAKLNPDWLLSRDNDPLNYQLDLTKPDVQKWVENELVRIIEEYELDLLRLDYNAFPGEGGYTMRDGYCENTIFRHYEAIYSIFENISRLFPNLILENCASGGGRTDLGMLSRMHYTWISDYVLPPRIIRMLNGMTMALAPDLLAVFSGVGMNGHLGGDLDLQLRILMMSGNPCLLGIFPTMANRNPGVVRKIKHMTDLFHNFIRPIILNCNVYPSNHLNEIKLAL
jgi:hypothetical protein